MSDEEMSVALLESLQRANPEPVEDVADRRALPSAHALLAEITARPPRRVRRRTVVVAIVLVILALAALIGAFAIVQRGRPAVTAPFCYEKPSLDSRRIVAGGDGGDPSAACAALWKEGDFAGPVPSHFDECVLRGGAPAVFPAESGSVCSALGLPEASPTRTDDRIARAGDEAGRALGGPDRCIGYDKARVIVQRILEQNGLHGWTVARSPKALAFSAARPCASPAVVAPQKTVFLIPGPPAGYVPPTTG